MLRWFPRRMRLKWIVFLLVVCFVGLYFTYRQLVESKQASSVHKHPSDRMPYHRPNKPNLLKHKPVAESKSDIKENDIHPAAPLMRNLEADSDYITSEEKNTRLKLLLNNLSPTNWKNALDAGEMMSIVKRELMDMDLVSKLSCQEIDALKLGSAHRTGFYGKKMVDYVMLAYPIELVVKSVGNDQKLKIECMKQDYNAERCANMANYKIMRELIYLLSLEHKSIIEMKGFCLRGETIDSRLNMKGAIIVTEGSRQLPEAFYNHCWSCRLEMVLDLLDLLLYMEKSPFGNLGFDQIHANDFVMVDSKLKLVDLDNLRTYEKPCETNKDCIIEDMPRKEIQCVASECKGRNSLNNLMLLSRTVLALILKFPPQGAGREVDRLLENIQNLQLTLAQVIEAVNKMLDKDDPHRLAKNDEAEIKGGLTIVDQGAERSQNRVAQRDMVRVVAQDANVKVREDDRAKQELESNRVNPHPPTTKKPVPRGLPNQDGPEVKYEYERHDNANFPALMTMVMKNSADAKPDPNYGATLFIKKKPINDVVHPTTFSQTACKLRAQNQTAKARLSRERRLMTHLGLKGTSESQWKDAASHVKIAKINGRSQLMQNNTVGGRFRLHFDKNTRGLTKGEFMAEIGPLQHHMGYIITYFVDRILGLYHTPPAVVRKLSLPEIRAMKGDKSWLSRMSKSNQSDGSGIQGLLLPQVPPVMKTSKITIPKLEKMGLTVRNFTRDEKVQVEYTMLKFLTKLLQPQHGYLGYKGHLIHFEADLAFQNVKQTLQGYFYNCQFPNSVYKTLVCYKCPGGGSRSTQICGLGEQAIDSIVRLGLREGEVRVGTYTSTDLKDIINNSAAVILTIVEHCIRTHSREKVLY